MYVRLAFAVAVHTDPDILLVDEVLAVGDETFQRKCMDRITQFRAEGRTIILVSHSAQQVAELCDRGIVLRDGAVIHDGDTNEAIRVLRESLDQRRRDSTSASDAQPISVTKVELLDRDGVVGNTIVSGDAVTIRIHVASEHLFDRWEVGFSIDTPFGHMVIASNTDILSSASPPRRHHLRRPADREPPARARTSTSSTPNVAGVSEVSTHALMQAVMLNVEGAEDTMGSSAAARVTVAGAGAGAEEARP